MKKNELALSFPLSMLKVFANIAEQYKLNGKLLDLYGILRMLNRVFSNLSKRSTIYLPFSNLICETENDV